MNLGVRRTSYGAGLSRHTYLVTDRGLDEGVGVTLKASAFASAPGVVEGVVPAGYPVKVANADNRLADPFTAAGPLYGLTINPADVSNGDAAVGVQISGDIDPKELARLIPGVPDVTTATGQNSFNFGVRI